MMGFSDKELADIYTAIESERNQAIKRNWGTPYVEKLLESLSIAKAERRALEREMENYRTQYLAQRDIADQATVNYERSMALREDEVKARDGRIKALERELKELPGKVREHDGIRCRSCKHAKRTWIFLRCRRYPISRLTWGGWTCGERA